MATEIDIPTLQKLCWLINEQWKVELAYSRAQYRVSYYRKLKAKLESSKKTSEKWNDHVELAKKIEATRLISLKKQGEVLKTKKRLKASMSAACKKLNASLIHSGGYIHSIRIVLDLKPYASVHEVREVNVTQIADYAEQHEVNTVLNKALSSKGNS